MANYAIARLDELPGVPCPCGTARRAFTDEPEGLATCHRTTISADARAHYHRHLTEVYYVLAGTGEMELDGERVPLAAGTAVLVKPGCVHRAVGTDLEVLITVAPAFDPADEHFP